MKVAGCIGIPIHHLWKMTPWQLKTYSDGFFESKTIEHDFNIWLMWQNAVLVRVKNIPKLSEFLTVNKKPNEKAVKGVDEGAILAFLQGAKAAYQQKIKAKK